MTVQAVLCDFDGTLADSYPAITASVNHVRGLHGLPPLPEAEVRRHVGYGPGHLLTHTVPGGDPAADVAAYRAHHPTVMFTGTRLLPGVADTLRQLHGRGVRLALCSNKPVAFSCELLAHLGLAPFLTAILGPEDVARPKPAPDLLLAALDRLEVAADRALYVGDMTVDVQAGRAAGVRVWVVPTGSDTPEALRLARPDRLLTTFADVAEVLTA